MKRIFTPKANGYLISNAVGFAIIGASKYLSGPGNNGVLIFSEFTIVPFLIGFISAWFWRNDKIDSMTLVSRCVLTCFIAIILTIILFAEGIICLVIVSPLVWSFIIAGAFTGRAMFRHNNDTLNVSVVLALLVVFAIDSTSVHHYENMVADRIIINAPVSRVWKNVVAYKRNTSPDKYWLFKMGMPSPVESTTEGYYVGAKRKCIFSNGYVFDEKIVVYQENKNLTFDITEQPRDPEIMGHIDILRGQFLLQDNGNGTTTVTGNSWYRLYVFPVWYYDIWAKSITRNVHIRVMEHIKEISEEQ
jgi:hypothetical protein